MHARVVEVEAQAHLVLPKNFWNMYLKKKIKNMEALKGKKFIWRHCRKKKILSWFFVKF